MADLKISQLSGATTPLAGTEVLPIVQSNTTKKVSVADLTAGRSISVADATLTTGNLIIGTSGKGIDFSATAGTGTSELLADYEEGTWTPTFTYETPGDLSVSYALQTGTYTKIGRLVTVSWSVQLSAYSQTTASGALSISGLPYSINAALAVQGSRGEVFFYNTITKAGYTDFSWLANGSTTLSLYAIGSGVAGATVTVANVTAGIHAYSGTYTYEV